LFSKCCLQHKQNWTKNIYFLSERNIEYKKQRQQQQHKTFASSSFEPKEMSPTAFGKSLRSRKGVNWSGHKEEIYFALTSMLSLFAATVMSLLQGRLGQHKHNEI
jgi:hypothetical protein